MDIRFLYKKNRAFQKINSLYKTMSPEKVLTLWVLCFFACISFFTSLAIINDRFLVTVPVYGGSIKEGLVGTPRFINPVLALTDQDKDLVAVIFAGLTKKTVGGEVVLDLADSIQESEDGLRYVVKIKDDARFHDGKPVTSEDIAFTVDKVQNPIIKSPHKVEWEGVDVEITGTKELTFVLKKPFPLFMETLSLGIIPKHIWKNLNEDQFSLSDLNVRAIGAGPYMLQKVVTESGIPTELQLEAFKHYTLGRPYLQTITISTYQNEKYLLKAFTDGDIQRVHGISPEKITTLSVATSSIKTSLLPRTFAVFFNPNKATPLADKNVRLALQMAIDKERIVREVFYGYGKTLNGPYPFDANQGTSEYNPEKARELLLTNKTIKKASSTLEISLTTANTDEMKKVAELIKSDWQKIGVDASIKIYDVSDLNQNIIKDRDFQVLLFGAITQTPSDLYAFWHSSQRTYPGLNISNYVSKTLDQNLEILRESRDETEKLNAYDQVVKEFKEEIPGIFLFSPSLIYVTNDKNTSIIPEYSYDASSRFSFIEQWFRYTDKVWPKTYKKDVIQFIQNIIH
jgi:peptide/nickel transport system substrate-binding protein